MYSVYVCYNSMQTVFKMFVSKESSIDSNIDMPACM